MIYQTTPAGLGVSTRYATMDFETYSEAGYFWDDTVGKWCPVNTTNKRGIAVVGTRVYAEHPSTEVLSLAYNFMDGLGPRLWLPGMSPPVELFDYISAGGITEIWSTFEVNIWDCVCIPRMGWPPLPLRQVRDAMSHAYAHSLPGKLKEAGAALKVNAQKGVDGQRLIRKFSIPRNPTLKDKRRRIRPSEDVVDGAKFCKYNIQDIAAHEAISDLIPDLSCEELEIWFLDQTINRRGVHIDREGMDNCAEVVRQATELYTAELQQLVRYDTEDGETVQLETADQLEVIKAWMRLSGVHVESLDADAVVAFLKRDDLPPEVYRAVEIRSILGSKSVKKLESMTLMTAGDGRLHDLFVYHKGHTGRFAGYGPQPQNLPSGGPIDDWGISQAEQALRIIASRSLSSVENWYGDAVKTVSGCLRALFCAAPGKDLVCSDFSAIEAVVLAELAGETWRQEVFRTHGKIYEMSAAKITGVPFDEFLAHRERTGDHHPLRKKIGKVAELASGYQGWIGAWKAFGADKHFADDRAIRDAILAWRAESPAIVEFWGGQLREVGRYQFEPEYYGIEGAAVLAVLNPGQCFEYRSISLGVKDNVLYCRLPSGRSLTYHSPELREGVDNYSKRPIWKLSYMGYNSDYKKGPRGWMRLGTYGGKLTENITQAVARDILVYSMLQVEAGGYPIVLHVHDEIVSEVPEGFGSVAEFERLMGLLPAWCADWPVKAVGGWRGKRYRKD